MAPKKKAAPKPEEPKATEKRKAEETPTETPAEKQQKKEDAKEEKPVEAAAEKVEQEKDAPPQKGATIKDKVCFLPNDMSLNVVPTMDDKLLSVLNDGGLQFLIAGARANVGFKSGRYMFEAKIAEVLNPAESSRHNNSRPPLPRQLLRIGVSTAGSSLVLGESVEHVCFDTEGSFFADKKKTPGVSKRFQRDQVVAVVLNLDPKSPVKNTISLFIEGERVAEPQPLPEALIGKKLYPHISFRNVTVQVLFDAEPAKPLPFKCHTIAKAATADCAVSTPPTGPFQVVFPVGLPDEGTFDWLDTFMAKNPNHVELSDRKLVEWALASGLWKAKGGGWKTSNNSNDKPEFNFGLSSMEDKSVQRVINNIAPLIPRNYVVMEVKSNLTADERAANLKRFSATHYKKIAQVVMGEPKADFKQAQHDMILKEKQDKLDAAHQQKKLEIQRKKQMKDFKKAMEEKKAKAAAELAAKKEAAAKEKADNEAKKDEKMEVDEEGKKEDKKEEPKAEKEEEPKQEKKEEEPKEEKKEEEPKEEKKEEEEKEEELPEEPEKAELTEEEKKLNFRPKTPSDLTPAVMNSAFAKFTIPEKSEGFDELKFEWQPEKASRDYLKKWVLEKKRTSRVEDLVPGQWFQDKLKAWQTALGEFQTKQKSAKPAESEKKEGDDADAKVSQNDIFSVTDLSDVGNGEALYKDFIFEDWALAQLRYEFFLLATSFTKDVNDPDREGIPEDHLSFYFNKYFRKNLNPKAFGQNTIEELIALIKDTVTFNDQKVLATSQGEDSELDMFVKLTEEKRRERQRRIDAGDETARLKFTAAAMQSGSKIVAPGGAGKGGGSWKKGEKGDGKRGRSSPYGQTGFQAPGVAGQQKPGKGEWGNKKW